MIKFILNPQNQAFEYEDKGNFPSAPAAFELPEVSGPVEFLGGQVASKVFGHAAETVRPLYEDPQANTVSAPFFAELDLVEASKKDPNKAWDDAVLRALDKTETLPRDVDGRVPPSLTIGFRPQD